MLSEGFFLPGPVALGADKLAVRAEFPTGLLGLLEAQPRERGPILGGRAKNCNALLYTRTWSFSSHAYGEDANNAHTQVHPLGADVGRCWPTAALQDVEAPDDELQQRLHSDVFFFMFFFSAIRTLRGICTSQCRFPGDHAGKGDGLHGDVDSSLLAKHWRGHDLAFRELEICTSSDGCLYIPPRNVHVQSNLRIARRD